tara:strand:- start:979 stop:1194 length:216 start_codon:yes stop_codon:yes gene_type:complete
MNILVNGRKYNWSNPTITYDDVVCIAEQPLASVIYQGAKKDGTRIGGILYGDKVIDVEEGMIFTAVRTGNA